MAACPRTARAACSVGNRPDGRLSRRAATRRGGDPYCCTGSGPKRRTGRCPANFQHKLQQKVLSPAPVGGNKKKGRAGGGRFRRNPSNREGTPHTWAGVLACPGLGKPNAWRGNREGQRAQPSTTKARCGISPTINPACPLPPRRTWVGGHARVLAAPGETGGKLPNPGGNTLRTKTVGQKFSLPNFPPAELFACM